jgi:hypothetical protein
MRIQLRSRTGSIVIGILGVIYAVAAAAILVLYVVDTWAAASLTDRALQLVLCGAIFISAWFISISAHTLGISLRRRRGARPHPADAAASS